MGFQGRWLLYGYIERSVDLIIHPQKASQLTETDWNKEKEISYDDSLDEGQDQWKIDGPAA